MAVPACLYPPNLTQRGKAWIFSLLLIRTPCRKIEKEFCAVVFTTATIVLIHVPRNS